MFGGDFGLPPGPRYGRRSTGGAPPLPSEAELMAMKMPALRAFAKEHCGAVSLALGGEQRRTKADVVRDVWAALQSRHDSDSA